MRVTAILVLMRRAAISSPSAIWNTAAGIAQREDEREHKCELVRRREAGCPTRFGIANRSDHLLIGGVLECGCVPASTLRHENSRSEVLSDIQKSNSLTA